MKEVEQIFLDGEIVSVGLQNISKDDQDIVIVFKTDDKEIGVYLDSYEFLKWFNKDMIQNIKEKLIEGITKI